VLCYNNVIATGAWFGLMRGGQSGKTASRAILARGAGGFADVPESALDDLPSTWVTTPAREMGQSLAECILRRLEKGQMSARNQLCPRGW
jgi:LacI family transcriptional regulator of maltose regulon